MTWGGAVNLSRKAPLAKSTVRASAPASSKTPKASVPKLEKKDRLEQAQTLSSNFYECKEPKCETEVKEKLGALGYSGVGFSRYV